jgi:sigma-54 dependent transcriptional regulator, acetoin dehydrogenase operon transcriptional activator AcoR
VLPPSRRDHNPGGRSLETVGVSRARARERFLEGRELAGDSVREAIVASWRRSQLAGVNVDKLEPLYAEVDEDSRLVQAARPVLDRLESVLAGAPMSVILTDSNARVLERRAGEKELNQHLDSILLAPGFSYAEEYVGTNGIGTAVEERRGAHVFGSEHFSERLQSMSCAGELIRNPLSGRIEGVIDVTCWSTHATPLMVALVQEAARDIERRLLEQSTERERALLAEFLASSRRGSRPILSLSDDLVITNSTAAHLLEPADYQVLREHAAGLVRARRETVVEVPLASGQTARLRCRPVPTRSGLAGAIVEISIGGPAYRDFPVSPVWGPLPGLAGGSASWLNACRQVISASHTHTRLLLVGEPGVGKLALAQAAHRRGYPSGHLAVVEAPGRGDSEQHWLSDVRSCLAAPEGTVVLRHVDQLGPALTRELAALLEGRAGPAPWIVGTMCSTEGGAELDALVNQFTETVTIPPLRHRIEDVRDLVPELLGRLAPGRQVSVQPAVMRTLLRAAWPGNVAELQQALREALSRRRVGEIAVEDLPAAAHSTSRRVLTEWEALERDAITRALLASGGDKVKAAAQLGISRATIYRKITSYGIRIDGQG